MGRASPPTSGPTRSTAGTGPRSGFIDPATTTSSPSRRKRPGHPGPERAGLTHRRSTSDGPSPRRDLTPARSTASPPPRWSTGYPPERRRQSPGDDRPERLRRSTGPDGDRRASGSSPTRRRSGSGHTAWGSPRVPENTCRPTWWSAGQPRLHGRARTRHAGSRGRGFPGWPRRSLASSPRRTAHTDNRACERVMGNEAFLYAHPDPANSQPRHWRGLWVPGRR